MINLLIGLISLIPHIDIIFTNFIYKLPIKKFSKYFSVFIIYFNLLVNLILLFYIPLKLVILRYLIELLIVNLIFKQIINRKRPKDSLFKCKEYFGINNFTLSFKINFNKTLDSFPSGHVTTVFCTLYLINNFINFIFLKKIYVLLLTLTFISRVNIGAHYFSDCVWAILISDYIYNI